jgi:methyl-galactoside transport system permease protein
MKPLNARSISEIAAQNVISIVLILLISFITIMQPSFFSFRVLRDLLLQNSTRLIIAGGMSFILISGGTDLGAGRMVGLAAVVAASMSQTLVYPRRFYPDLPELMIIVPILAAIAVCIVWGAINGIMVAKFNIPPFIATLGSQVAIYGANSLYYNMPPNNSQPIGGIRPELTRLGSGFIGKIPIVIIFSVCVIVAVWIILSKTRFGRNVYAIGGNKEAAMVSGIKVQKTMILVYIIGAALFGLAGILECAKSGGATSNYGNMYEFDAISACVVGGVSLNGGVGTVPGIIVGVFIFGIISYGLTFIGVSPYWQLIVKGVIIALAVGLDMRKYHKSR